MERFYLKERKDTLAVQNAPSIPKGFFSQKKRTPEEKLAEEIKANEYANIECEQMLMTLKGDK